MTINFEPIKSGYNVLKPKNKTKEQLLSGYDR